MSIRKQISLVAATILMDVSCGTSVKDSASDISFTVGSVSSDEGCPEGNWECRIGKTGHEVLTRMAKDQANSVAQINYFLDYGESENIQGQRSLCPIIRGNFATDKPDVIKESWDIRKQQKEGFNIDLSEDTHLGLNRQSFHALRNFKSGTDGKLQPWSNNAACEEIKNVIKITSRAVADKWKKLEINTEAQYLIGTVTHTIQDSFSKAHTERDPKTTNFKQLCTYGEEFVGICNHSKLEAVTDDFIWYWTSGLLIMKREARTAAYTTAAYLLHMVRITEMDKDFDTEINDFFAGSPVLRKELTDRFASDEEYEPLPKTGTFDCSALKD